jgi:sec-independent protein translocase protein TatA
MPFGLQPFHLVVIVLVALVVFGPKRLPQLGRWLGKTFSEFRKGARDMADEFKAETGSQNAVSPKADAPETGSPEVVAREAVAGAPGNFCTGCGASNPADARFCNKCGTRLPA